MPLPSWCDFPPLSRIHMIRGLLRHTWQRLLAHIWCKPLANRIHWKANIQWDKQGCKLGAMVVCKDDCVDALWFSFLWPFCLPILFQPFLPGFSSVLVVWTAQNPWKAYQWRPVEETQQVSLTGSAASYSGVKQFEPFNSQWCSLVQHCDALCICVVCTSDTHGDSLLTFATTIASFVSGSGYFIDLPANKSHASSMLSDLHVWRWVDKLTRAFLAWERPASKQRREVCHRFFTHTNACCITFCGIHPSTSLSLFFDHCFIFGLIKTGIPWNLLRVTIELTTMSTNVNVIVAASELLEEPGLRMSCSRVWIWLSWVNVVRMCNLPTFRSLFAFPLFCFKMPFQVNTVP